jgi:hypothetical protein
LLGTGIFYDGAAGDNSQEIANDPDIQSDKHKKASCFNLSERKAFDPGIK